MVTSRAAGVTAAAGTGLSQPLFPKHFTIGKSLPPLGGKHSGSPRHTSVHCEDFAPGAPRRAWNLVSDPNSGLPLSRPIPVIGLVGLYPANYLIGHGPILQRRSIWAKGHSSSPHLWRISLSFPRLSASAGQVSRVLLSIPPPARRRARLPWLSRSPIPVTSSRINWS
jgi:hypothetical protein